MELETLGELDLAWRTRPDVAPAGKFGRYLGRGDGTFVADDVAGEVTWDLYEDQGDDACDANLRGRIRTAQGGEIAFEALGFFRRQEGSALWHLTSAVRFDCDDPRLERFHGRLGFLTGVFDLTSYRHRYRVFAAPTDILAAKREADAAG